MMKNKKKIIIISIIVVVVLVIGLFTYRVFSDKTRLSITENKWIDENKSNIQNINIINDNSIFGFSGSGVFFDFLNDFSDEYGIGINPIAINSNENPSGITLGYTLTKNANDTVIYEDHYVIMSKNYELINDYESLNDKTVGILNRDLTHVSNYLNSVRLNYNQYESKEKIETALKEGNENYILVPLNEYMDVMLSENLFVIEHLSDIPIYYVLRNNDKTTLGNILSKYVVKWSSKLDNSYNMNKFNLFTSKLNISETEVDALRSMDYNYGFVNTSPFEVISGGNYGGIVAVYLEEFSSFADLDINFTKYKNINRFLKALDKSEVDMYYNYYNLNNNYQTVKGNMGIEYAVITRMDNQLVVNSLNSLKNQTVYVLNNSIIASHLANIESITIKTYNTNKDLLKVAKKDAIIVLDKNVFEYYQTNELKNYVIKDSDYLDAEYTFKINNTNAFYKLFNKYINTIDYKWAINEGIYNHNETIKSGTLLGKMARYFLYILGITFIVVLVVYKKSKKIKIAKRIKKEDKIKYVDQLTTLKNRNYLNENLENWNNNKVYPQTMLVVDLNNIQYINDTKGYEEGDKQIKAMANLLIKTQLDYSDIIRTDGNEFLIYMIGYTPKQVTNYIHKLKRELKKLPYEYGAEFGFSTINDDIKTIEDAINEAVEEMRLQKKAVEENEKTD